MNKRIRKKLEKINNTNRINEILKSLNYTIQKKIFGSGYFLFDFEKNSICWFWLKEFPDWKFGIWLNDNSYDIFGEHTILIDKFKPSASYMSFNNVQDFNNDLQLILIKDKSHLEYFEEIEKQTIYQKEKREYLLNLTKDIYDYIKYFNIKYKNKYLLKLKDYGSCRTPRYEIHIYYYDKYELTVNDEYDIYLDLSKVREKSYDAEKEYNWLGENFIVQFTYIHKELLTELEFIERKERFNWNNEDKKDFKSFIKN